MKHMTIQIEPASIWGYSQANEEATIVMVYTGNQWEQIGPVYESVHDALQIMNSLLKWHEFSTQAQLV